MIDIIHGSLRHLFLGDRSDAIRCSRDGSVDIIIYLGQEMNEQKMMYGSRVPVVHIPLKDGYNSSSKISYVLLNLSHRIPGVFPRILLACRYGVSRSSALTICYLSTHLDFLFDEAFDLVKEKNPKMLIEPHLYKAVKDYVEEIRK